VELEDVWMCKSVNLWKEHTDISAGHGKVVGQFPRLKTLVWRF